VTTLRQRAREAYADEFDRLGPSWARLADQIRSGFENLWVTPALSVIERLLGDDDALTGPDHLMHGADREDEGDEEGGAEAEDGAEGADADL
jgi:hypothetical protein